jgi:hypothetical protein
MGSRLLNRKKEKEKCIVWNNNNDNNVGHVGRRHHGHLIKSDYNNTVQQATQDVDGSNICNISNSRNNNKYEHTIAIGSGGGKLHTQVRESLKKQTGENIMRLRLDIFAFEVFEYLATVQS